MSASRRIPPEAAGAAGALWEELMIGSAALAEEIGLEPDASAFAPGALEALDAWRRERAALDDDGAVRLGLYLARLLIERHGGGLSRIAAPGHPLDGEWAITGFQRGLASDYHAPFLVAGTRLARDPAYSARAWYRQLLDEGRP